MPSIGQKKYISRKISYPQERFQTCRGQAELSRPGSTFAEYQTIPPYDAFKQGRSYSSQVGPIVPTKPNFSNKCYQYKKAASTLSLEKYANENIAYNDRLFNTKGGVGLVYDTDIKHHYDRIVVVPGNAKPWSDLTNNSNNKNCANNGNVRYGVVPKPLPRSDSLRGRTKSVAPLRPTVSFNAHAKSNYNDKHKLRDNSVPPNDGGSMSYDRATSAPPASPRSFYNPNRFTCWFGSSSSNNSSKSLFPSKLNRYVIFI